MHARVYRDAARPEGGHLWHAKLRPAQCSHVHPSPYKICCYARPLCESGCMYGLPSLASICSSLAEEAGAFKAKCHLERESRLKAERQRGTPAASETAHGKRRDRAINNDVLMCMRALSWCICKLFACYKMSNGLAKFKGHPEHLKLKQDRSESRSRFTSTLHSHCLCDLYGYIAHALICFVCPPACPPMSF